MSRSISRFAAGMRPRGWTRVTITKVKKPPFSIGDMTSWLNDTLPASWSTDVAARGNIEFNSCNQT